ncbi:hypothetical protein POM88_005652 [Heracleum sosnowskyi]|uniref:Aminotransferase-like plant mobile domain-containing protein n=1 Tax=Heracleum sosnowskyi TaxID=360622 RepID=A0AAD8J2R0_9APIA|nr:hypothetical protein POM88_005652 [Heracleum sosnowskyi]
MAHFFVNNRFLRAAVKFFENGTFKCNGELLYLGLEDVFYITGLPVDGSPIVCGEFNQEKILEDMLGADDPKRKGAYVSKEWLRKRFEKVREEDIQDENTRTIWLQRYARAYLLFLMGTILFPEKHKHTVFIGYMLFLTDLTPRVFGSDWFDRREACESREAVKKIIEEEIIREKAEGAHSEEEFEEEFAEFPVCSKQANEAKVSTPVPQPIVEPLDLQSNTVTAHENKPSAESVPSNEASISTPAAQPIIKLRRNIVAVRGNLRKSKDVKYNLKAIENAAYKQSRF